MFQIESETYFELKNALKDMLDSIEKLHKVEINDKEYFIKYMMAGDMKFLSLIYGLNAANSNQPCIWCKVNLKESLDIECNCTIDRSLNEAFKKYSTGQDGYKNEPIIKFIEFDCIVIDLLHLLLRISDRLFNFLINKLIFYDKNDSTDLEKRPNFKIFINFLTMTCK